MPDKPSAAPRKHEILALFADRMFTHFAGSRPREEPPGKKRYLNLNPDLTKQSLCPLQAAEKVQLEYAQVLNEDRDCPVKLVIKIVLKLLRVTHMVNLSIETEGDAIANLNFLDDLSDKGYLFEIYHRIVKPEFRGPQNSSGERLSNILLKAAEDYVRHVAEQTKKPQVIGLKTSQLEVILWMLENGYEIATEDQTWWDLIRVGDPHLVMRRGRFHWVEDLADIAKLRIQEAGRGYFHIDPPSINIHFKKNISPDMSQEAAVAEVRRAVAGS